MMERKCGSCRSWDPDEKTCKHESPRLGPEGEALWPRVEFDNWCARWEVPAYLPGEAEHKVHAKIEDGMVIPLAWECLLWIEAGEEDECEGCEYCRGIEKRETRATVTCGKEKKESRRVK